MPSRLPWMAAGVLLGLIGLLAGWRLQREAPAQLVEFIEELAEGRRLATIGRPMSISPDGSAIVYAANDQLWLREMDDVQVRPIPGTEGGGAEYPIFSPDGSSIVYWASQDGELRKLEVTGGTADVLSRGVGVVRGIHWSGNSIYLGQGVGVVKIPENGGSAESVFLDPAGEFFSPRLLPGATAMLGIWSTVEARSQVAVYDFDTQTMKTFFPGQSPRYLEATGHLIYVSVAERALMAVEFDPDALEVIGSPVAIAEDLGVGTLGGAWQFDVSDNGTLVYAARQPGTAFDTGRDRRATLVWVDTDGDEEPIDIRPDDYTMARISPDGTKVVLVIGDARRTDGALLPDLWMYDLVAGTLSQRTFNPAVDDGPVWAPDSSGMYFRSNRNSGYGVYFLPAEGGEAQLVFMLEDAPIAMPWSVSSDGQTLALVNARSLTDANIAVVSLDEEQTFRELLADEGRSESQPVLSSSGKWIAYQDAPDETSMPQLAVRPFPDFERTEYPLRAGMHPVFSQDDSELFYFDGEGISIVALEYEPDFSYRPGRRLFTGDYWYGVGGPEGNFGRAWDVDPSGERLLMISDASPRAGGSEESRPTIHVVLNWFTELRERVPLE